MPARRSRHSPGLPTGDICRRSERRSAKQYFSEKVPGGLQYRGEYLIPIGERLAEQYGRSLAQPDGDIAAPEVWLDIVRDFTIAAMLRDIREDLHLLGVEQDVFSSERALIESGAVDASIEWFHSQGLIYEGVLDPPKGKTPDDWEPRPQTLFRATQFGDDVDRPLRKSDGSNTYFANDIAYHADKVRRGYDVLIDVLGADHGGYVKRVRAAVNAVSQGRTAFEAILCQTVHVMRGGQPVRMSKRRTTCHPRFRGIGAAAAPVDVQKRGVLPLPNDYQRFTPRSGRPRRRAFDVQSASVDHPTALRPRPRPRVNIGDNVQSPYRLVTEHFGIERPALVLGRSMGAGQTYQRAATPRWSCALPTVFPRGVARLWPVRLGGHSICSATTSSGRACRPPGCRRSRATASAAARFRSGALSSGAPRCGQCASAPDLAIVAWARLLIPPGAPFRSRCRSRP